MTIKITPVTTTAIMIPTNPSFCYDIADVLKLSICILGVERKV